ncbi:MAG: O-antigen ligase family protein [Chitinophagaceae bacterium]|nr:O-antigen ligase family protein [Oligoflexus sp.]
MTESVHKGVSPSVKVENQIIDKNPRKWEHVLLHLVVFTILLPVAAQSIAAGLLGLSFLIPRGWQAIGWSDPIPALFIKMVKTLSILWAIFLISGVAEAVSSGEWNHFMPYLRLIGKQGLFGSITIAAFLSYQNRSTRSWLSVRALIAFTVFILIYSIMQRYYGMDWVHGFHAHLDSSREAYGVYRVSGWMDHPLTFSYNLMLFTLLSFAHSLFLKRNGKGPEARLWLFQGGLLFVNLLLTDSRFPIILTSFILILGGAWDFPKMRKFLFAGSLLGILLAVALVLTLPHEALGRWGEFFDPNVPLEQRFDRLIFWKINWRLFMENPVFGTGLKRYDAGLLDTYLQAGYTSLERKYNAHNIYLQTLADGGLVSAIGLAFLLTAVGRLAFEVKKHFAHLALSLIFIATLGCGLVQNHLRDSEYVYALWACIGLCLSWLIVQRNQNEPRPGSQLQDLEP